MYHDKNVYIAIFKVFEDYDCMLNQTNIGHNNNKYYVIQVLKRVGAPSFYAWNRWGRVVGTGLHVLIYTCRHQMQLHGPFLQIIFKNLI